jgi:hypothetical protein
MDARTARGDRSGRRGEGQVPHVPPPLAGLGREADRGWGEGAALTVQGVIPTVRVSHLRKEQPQTTQKTRMPRAGGPRVPLGPHGAWGASPSVIAGPAAPWHSRAHDRRWGGVSASQFHHEATKRTKRPRGHSAARIRASLDECASRAAPETPLRHTHRRRGGNAAQTTPRAAPSPPSPPTQTSDPAPRRAP